MDSESRWPQFAPRAAELGVGSMLVLPLNAPRGTLGSLNLYARATSAFDQDSALIADAFATHAGIALAHAQMESNLRTAMTSREEIGRAVGILMERHRVAATQAFDMLVFVSQRTHRKLRDIAAWVDATGEDPSVLLPVGHRRPPTRG
jgi:GAF domain-containing protein